MDNNPKLYEGAVVQEVECGKRVTVGQYSTVRSSILADDVAIQRFNAIDSSVLGTFSYTGRCTTILHSVIGAFCSISWGVSVGGANHDYRWVTTHNFAYEPSRGIVRGARNLDRFEKEECVIGNDVWIGTGAIVNRGVHVGDGAIIGAGAVVTHDVDPYSIVAGVPAREIGRRFDDITIDRLLSVRWWDFPIGVIKENAELFQKDAVDSIDALERIRQSLSRGNE